MTRNLMTALALVACMGFASAAYAQGKPGNVPPNAPDDAPVGGVSGEAVSDAATGGGNPPNVDAAEDVLDVLFD